MYLKKCNLKIDLFINNIKYSHLPIYINNTFKSLVNDNT